MVAYKLKAAIVFFRFFTVVLVRPWTSIFIPLIDWCKVGSISIPSSRLKADTSSSSNICKVFSPMDSTSTAAVWMRWWADVSPAENVTSAASSSGESASHERQPCFNAGCTARRRDFHPHRQLLPIALMKLPTVRHWVTYDRGAGTPDGKPSLMDSYKRRPYLYTRNSGVMLPSFRVMISFPLFWTDRAPAGYLWYQPSLIGFGAHTLVRKSSSPEGYQALHKNCLITKELQDFVWCQQSNPMSKLVVFFFLLNLNTLFNKIEAGQISQSI